jgi:hypothetical protein
MQVYKLKGNIDHSGHLVIHEPIVIPPGDVEVIVWPSEPEPTPENVIPLESRASTLKPRRKVNCDIPVLKEWLEKTEPAPLDFDVDQAKWEHLKEKHNL